MRRPLNVDTHASSCFFRTSVDGDNRKALVQITERCNLHCAHCFVSSGPTGTDMTLGQITDVVVPRLRAARVERITLTGGEPFVHPDIVEICQAITEAGFPLGVCSNATLIEDRHIDALTAMDGVHVNVSFDGFRPESHGRFRGDTSSFAVTLAATRKLGDAGLLQGLLSTPNTLADPSEFSDLCRFAAEVGATYVLLNPLSAFGRGQKSIGKLGADDEQMRHIVELAQAAADGIELVPIRFPNDIKPLAGCDAGKFLYVFADGLTALCPYLVFAARGALSTHPESDFTVGNILEHDIAAPLDDDGFHHRFTVGSNAKCTACELTGTCGKGCPAAVVARGGRVGDVDSEQCPVSDEHVRYDPTVDGQSAHVPMLHKTRVVPAGAALLPLAVDSR